MADDEPAVGGEAYVKLKAIASRGKTEIKGGKSIFRKVGEARPAMTEQQGHVQSRSKSRIGFPVSGVSLARFTAS